MHEFYSPRRFFFITTSQKNLEQNKIKWRNREPNMESFDFFPIQMRLFGDRCVVILQNLTNHFTMYQAKQKN